MNSRSKSFEARHAIEDGANEIDMVMNIGALKSGDTEAVEEDVRWVLRACGQRTILKVIIETALLTNEEIVLACQICKKAGSHFVKTSTGFSTAGATPEHVALMRKTVGADTGVKAAGGVRTFEDAVRMIEAGATRLGTSGGIKIISGQTIESGY
jgi:deoxyribose-phosphate aldolase